MCVRAFDCMVVKHISIYEYIPYTYYYINISHMLNVDIKCLHVIVKY